MHKPTPDQLNRAINRSSEVLEAIHARKGNVYAMRVDMFVACTKMQVQVFGTDPRIALQFATNLLDAFDIPVAERDEFIDNCEAVAKVQTI